MHAPQVSPRCFVLFLNEFEFLCHFRQGKSTKLDEKFDSLAYLYVQMCFSCSENSTVCSRSGLGEVWMQVSRKRPTWGELQNSPFHAPITSNFYWGCSIGARDAPAKFLLDLGNFWVNRTIHLFMLRIDQNLICSFPMACTSPACDF